MSAGNQAAAKQTFDFTRHVSEKIKSTQRGFCEAKRFLSFVKAGNQAAAKQKRFSSGCEADI